ncbi:DUF89 family protein [Candidatus Sumerlaeota bacterium]|nr:DUF89 family protein [Candidatus Sumerlaeota bacterium]
MKTSLDCIPCFLRQSLEAARFVTNDSRVHEKIMRDILRISADLDMSASPPLVGQIIHRRLRLLAHKEDPYREVKDRFNRMALDILPEWEAKMKTAEDPFALALRLAIAGNIIDLGVNGNLRENDARQIIAQTLSEPFYGDISEFRNAVDHAERILYLADNAGEIIFDRLLVENLPLDRTTVVVRGRPIINDATIIDAEIAGITELTEVIDNGSDAPGTILSDCSDELKKRFEQADLIIAKGQGNYETLSDEPANIFFLFKAKCPVIAADVGLQVGTHALISAQTKLNDK